MKATPQFNQPKMNYEDPRIDVVHFLGADIITASDSNQGEWDPQPNNVEWQW